MFRRKLYLSVSSILTFAHIGVFSWMLATLNNTDDLPMAIIPAYSLICIFIQFVYTIFSMSMPTITTFGMIPATAIFHILIGLAILIAGIIKSGWFSYWLLYPIITNTLYIIFGIVVLIRKGDVSWEFESMFDPFKFEAKEPTLIQEPNVTEINEIKEIEKKDPKELILKKSVISKIMSSRETKKINPKKFTVELVSLSGDDPTESDHMMKDVELGEPMRDDNITL